MALIEAEGLAKRVEERWLWRGLDIALAPGERLAVRGPSGAGKTLLLRALAGLEPLEEGVIRYRDRELVGTTMPSYRAQVVYLAQRPAAVAGTVEDALRLPFRFRVHHGRPFPRDAILADLAALGRDETFLRRPAERLSGGEAQLVALLRAFAIAPQVLLLDEPAASLDEEASDALEALVGAWLHADRSRAVMWTSHHAAQLARVTDRSVWIGAAA
ncbi:MAG: ATP-binding cassette domain-containing protein [Trueperaceae bacterium]|nr:ATP-binding cassette domain-containing protein [Trueperaceae bacterium]